MTATPSYNRATQILIGIAVCVGWVLAVYWVFTSVRPATSHSRSAYERRDTLRPASVSPGGEKSARHPPVHGKDRLAKRLSRRNMESGTTAKRNDEQKRQP